MAETVALAGALGHDSGRDMGEKREGSEGNRLPSSPQAGMAANNGGPGGGAVGHERWSGWWWGVGVVVDGDGATLL